MVSSIWAGRCIGHGIISSRKKSQVISILFYNLFDCILLLLSFHNAFIHLFSFKLGNGIKISRRWCMIDRQGLDALPFDFERINLIIFIWCAIIHWALFEIAKSINRALRTVDAWLVEAAIIRVCAPKMNQSNQFRTASVVFEYRKLHLQWIHCRSLEYNNRQRIICNSRKTPFYLKALFNNCFKVVFCRTIFKCQQIDCNRPQMATIWLISTNIKRDNYHEIKVKSTLEHEPNQIAETIEGMFAVRIGISREVEETIVDRKETDKQKIDPIGVVQRNRIDKIKFSLKCSQIRLVSSSVNFGTIAIWAENVFYLSKLQTLLHFRFLFWFFHSSSRAAAAAAADVYAKCFPFRTTFPSDCRTIRLAYLLCVQTMLCMFLTSKSTCDISFIQNYMPIT